MPKNKKPLKEEKAFSRSQPAKETNQSQFWAEVEEKSKSLIADLIEKVLPISAVPSVFNLEKDTDYRVLLREDLPMYYQDNEEYQEKISAANWTEEDVEYVAEDLTCAYLEIVIKALVDWLSQYQGFDNTTLTNLGGI